MEDVDRGLTDLRMYGGTLVSITSNLRCVHHGDRSATQRKQNDEMGLRRICRVRGRGKYLARAGGDFGMPCADESRQGCTSCRIAGVLRDKMGNVAMPGEPFNSIDIYVKGLPNRRYMFVWSIGSRWIVATEVGGIALHAAVSTYDLGKDGKAATLLDQRMTSPTYACAVATKLAGP
jgi:hypothetical protein